MVGSSFADVVRKVQRSQPSTSAPKNTNLRRDWIDQSPSKLAAYYSSSANSSPLSLFPEEKSPPEGNSPPGMPFPPRPPADRPHMATSSAPPKREPDSAPSSEESETGNLRTVLSNRLVSKVLHEVKKSMEVPRSASSSDTEVEHRTPDLSLERTDTKESFLTASLAVDSTDSEKGSLPNSYTRALEKAVQIISRNLDELSKRVGSLERRDQELLEKVHETENSCLFLNKKLDDITHTDQIRSGIDSLQQTTAQMRDLLSQLHMKMDSISINSNAQLLEWLQQSNQNRENILVRLAHCEALCQVRLQDEFRIISSKCSPIPSQTAQPNSCAPSDAVENLKRAKSESAGSELLQTSPRSMAVDIRADSQFRRKWSVQKHCLTTLTSASSAPTKATTTVHSSHKVHEHSNASGNVISDRLSEASASHTDIESRMPRSAKPKSMLERQKPPIHKQPTSWDNRLSFVSILQERRHDSEKNRN